MARKYAAEFLGTMILVFFGAGVAALVLGFRIFGSSLAAGTIAVALAFGLTYAALVYVIGPISGAHVNPAVTLGAYIARRLTLIEAAGYWVAQLAGGIVGALLLWWMMRTSPFYAKPRIGLGANGYGTSSILHISGGGAFLVEVILTTFFVLVVLSLTREMTSLAVSGLGIGVALAVAVLIGVPFDGASVNPARSLGPAVVVGGAALSQVWVFLVAPMAGAVLAAALYLLVYPPAAGLFGRRTKTQAAATQPADEQLQPADQGTATTTRPEAATWSADAGPGDATQLPRQASRSPTDDPSRQRPGS
jgi:aquaporin Z